MNSTRELTKVNVSEITLDTKAQPRTELNSETIQEYPHAGGER